MTKIETECQGIIIVPKLWDYVNVCIYTNLCHQFYATQFIFDYDRIKAEIHILLIEYLTNSTLREMKIFIVVRCLLLNKRLLSFPM